MCGPSCVGSTLRNQASSLWLQGSEAACIESLSLFITETHLCCFATLHEALKVKKRPGRTVDLRGSSREI
jgi:hypothetical protein